MQRWRFRIVAIIAFFLSAFLLVGGLSGLKPKRPPVTQHPRITPERFARWDANRIAVCKFIAICGFVGVVTAVGIWLRNRWAVRLWLFAVTAVALLALCGHLIAPRGYDPYGIYLVLLSSALAVVSWLLLALPLRAEEYS